MAEAQECGGEVTALRGRVSYPGRRKPQYEPNLFCVWNLNFSPTDQIAVSVKNNTEGSSNCSECWKRSSSIEDSIIIH